MSDDKTRTEYEAIKARWSALPGACEDKPYVEDDTGKTYRYLTLREETSMDLDAVEEAAGRFARLAVLDNAYLTMNVHPRLGTVTICVGLATYDVPQHARTCERVTHPNSAHPCDCGLDAPLISTAAVANVAREMLADAPGRYNVGLQPCKIMFRGEAHDHECPTCGGVRAWCDNCHSDHHAGGWETCKPSADIGVTPDERARPTESADPESESLGLGVEG